MQVFYQNLGRAVFRARLNGSARRFTGLDSEGRTFPTLSGRTEGPRERARVFVCSTRGGEERDSARDKPKTCDLLCDDSNHHDHHELLPAFRPSKEPISAYRESSLEKEWSEREIPLKREHVNPQIERGNDKNNTQISLKVWVVALVSPGIIRAVFVTV